MSNRNIADLFGNSATRNVEDEQKNNNINDNVNINVNDNTNVNEDENINENVNDNVVTEEPKVKKKANEDILELLKDNNDKKVVGFHLDKDVRDAFQKVLGKKPPRGAQSKLANKIFRDFFEERDLL
ncbi:hypothetical protein PDK22_26060 [Bacillus cereus group sp. BY122LC]|uniref:hypothetical protein n=1 Tax=Bacillus cereus group sp. BY122LC TaxID=3018085 RepID=UPI0022E382C5|nr:hypothetical protein [Bacillus cereus group sp. BY122LC]MDA1861155.1 hypothetical protein [Bacillus cereus group sp. BY122LC]